MAYKTNLNAGSANFEGLMENGFGVVTVMNPKIYDALDADVYRTKTAYEVIQYVEGLGEEKLLCELDTLKIANVTQEGPTKTITGGQFSNPLVKFGKTARLEMQDALGKGDAIEYLCGGFQEWNPGVVSALHFGEDFQGPKLIIGDSFFIERKSGKQVKVKIIFYQFLPDSIFNLTQDAEGDATVFDMNGDLLTTIIKVGDASGNGYLEHGVFYSIVDPDQAPVTERTVTNTAATISVQYDTSTEAVYYSQNNGLTWSGSLTNWAKDDVILAKVVKGGVIVYSTTIVAAANKATA